MTPRAFSWGALAIALAASLMPVAPAMADGRDRQGGRDRHPPYHREYRPGYRDSQPVYAPVPYYGYAPPVSPGVNIFLPLNIRIP